MVSPNFFCGGASKSGTTTIYDVLKQHPNIVVPIHKETHFFSDNSNFEKGLEWYGNNMFESNKGKIVADFSPSYLFMDYVPERIALSLGTKIKLFFILRHPVDRAYSQYLHNTRDLRENLSFEEALAIEFERYQSIKPEDYVNYTKFAYQKQSRYSEGLERYYQYFDKENIKVVIFEEFFKHQNQGIVDLLNFLGVDSDIEALNTNLKSNVAAKARSKTLKKLLISDNVLKKVIKALIPSFAFRQKIRRFIQSRNKKSIQKDKLTPEFKQKILNQYFREDIEKTEKLLGRDLSIWYK